MLHHELKNVINLCRKLYLTVNVRLKLFSTHQKMTCFYRFVILSYKYLEKENAYISKNV